MEFKGTCSTSDIYDDLFLSGGISPMDLLADEEDAKKVLDAIQTIDDFLVEGEFVGAIEVL